MESILKKCLFTILSLFILSSSYAQFTSYSTNGTPLEPNCPSLAAGTEVWGGFGVTTIGECVAAGIKITTWNLQPYGPGWFGDTQGDLYYFDGTFWDMMPNTSCGGGGGCPGPDPNTWYIATTGDDATGDGSQTCPFATLNAAVTSAAAGDVINIEAGTYGRAAGQATGWQNITTNKALTIIGAGNAEEVSGGTVIDNDDRANERLIYFNSTTTGEIIIKNLIVRDYFEDRTIYIQNAENDVKLINITVNSCIAEGNQGNVYVDIDSYTKFTNSDSVIVKNCTFSNNTTDGLSTSDYPGLKLNGGTYGYGNALVEGCTFSGNSNAAGSTATGRVLYVYRFEKFNMKKCRFTDNDNNGYVVYLYYPGAYDQYSAGDVNAVNIENCVFDNNDVKYSTIYLRHCKGNFSNSTWAYNSSTSGSGTASNIDGYTSSMYYERVPDFKFYNCIFQTSDAGNYNIDEPNSGYEFYTLYNCLVEGGHASTDYTVGANVVSGDPLFTSNTDLSLNSILSPACNVGCDPGTNSCANSFTPSSSDMNNGTGYRDVYTPYDLGAYESTFSCSAPTVDIDPLDESVCIGSTPTTLSISATGASSYQWYFNTTNSNTGGTIMSAETSSTLVFPGGVTNPGNYYYYCTVSNVCGNATSNVAALTVNVNPTNTITVTETSGTANDGTICDGSSVTLDAGSATAYTWDNGLPPNQTVNPSPTTTTTYNVTVTDANGCTATDDQIITVGATPAISGVTSGNVAPGGTLSFDATLTDCANGSSSGPHDFTSTVGWSSGTGFGTSSAEACDGNLYRDNAYSSYPDVYFSNSTSFLTSAGADITVSFEYKCYDYYSPYTPTTTIEHKGQFVEYATTALGPWTTVYTMTDYTASATCVTKTFSFTPTSGQPVFLRFHTLWFSGDFYAAYDDITVSEGGCTYAWTGPNSYTADTEDITVTTNASSSHAGDYTLTATNQYECSASTTATMTVNCPIVVDAGAAQSINQGQTLSFDATVTCSPSSGTVDDEGIGSGNYASSMTSILATPGGFWSNVSGDNAQVWGESNITGSSLTGPDAPNTGDDYIYFETSSGHAYYNGDIVYLESNTISDNGVSISFYYHMFGVNIGTLEIESYDGSTWTSRWSLSGQQQVTGADPWIQATVDMAAYTVTKLRFKYTAAGGYRGDAALDDIIISYNIPCTYAWTGPNNYTANTEDVTVTTNALNGTHDGTYTLTVDNGSCSSSDQVVATVSNVTVVTWVGGTSTDWTDANNWNYGVVPTIDIDVIIPSGTNNVPTTPVSGNVYAKNLTLHSGASMIVRNTAGSGTKLTIGEDITLNGTLSQTGDADILLDGAVNTFNVSGVATTTSGRFTIDGVYTLVGDLTVTSIDIPIGSILKTNTHTLRTYNIRQLGKLMMTTGDLYVEGSVTTFNNPYFTEGTGTVHIGKTSSTWNSAVNQTVTSGIQFYNLKLYTSNGYTITMGTGLGDHTVNTVWFLNPNTAGGTITLGDHMIVNADVNMQTSDNSLILRLNYRLYRPSGTGTFTMGNEEDNQINIYYEHATLLAIDGFGSITFYGSVSNMGNSPVIPATYQTLEVNQAGATATMGADMTINGNVLISDGTLDAQSHTLTVKGNWTVAPGATFTAGTGKVTFEGSDVQTVTTKGQNFNDVEINNTNNPIAINVVDGMILGTSGVLKLTDGVIKTVGTAPFCKVVIKNNEPNAIVGSDGTPHNLSPSSYVWGNLKRHTKPSGYSGKQKYEFPIGIVPPGGGSQARYYRTRVDFTGLQGVSNITARFVVGEHPAYTSETEFANQQYGIPQTDSTDAFTLARMLGEGYWRIHPNQQPSSGAYDIVLFTGVFDGQGSSGKTAPVKTDTSNTNVASWAIAGNLASDNSGNRQNSAGKIKSYGLTSFSDFGVGDGGGAALPIELLNFSAVMNGDKVTLSWTTATELNNDYFTVERTLDGIAFEEVVEMPGAGTSFTPMTYISEDASPLPGRSYYRLKQTDYDGQFEYSSMVEVENDYISDMNLYEITVANNTKVVLNYHLTNHDTYYLYVYDIMGKVVKEDMVYSEEGTNKYELNVKSFPSGTYFISLQTQNEIYSERFVVRR